MKLKTNLSTIRNFVFAFILASILGLAQEQSSDITTIPDIIANFNNIGGASISYSPGASPSIAGTGLYARRLSSSEATYSSTYAFTIVDALPTTLKPFSVTTQFAVGIAQKVMRLGNAIIYVPTSAGISYTGSNTGWAWSTGGLAVIPVAKGKWAITPSLRFLKSSVSNGTGYQVIGGIGFVVGWN